MLSTQHFSSNMREKNGRYGIVATHWNDYIVDALIRGAEKTLLNHGVLKENIQLVRCPGAFEVPLIVKKMAKMQYFDAIIALGAVIRGSTPHFEYVAGESVKGIMSTMLHHEIPVTFGILTVDTIEQAIERAGTKLGNKGTEAALAAIEMVNVLHDLNTKEHL